MADGGQACEFSEAPHGVNKHKKREPEVERDAGRWRAGCMRMEVSAYMDGMRPGCGSRGTLGMASGTVEEP